MISVKDKNGTGGCYSMIHSDCKDCEYYDGCNKRYPCKLDNPLRCTILHRWVKEKRITKGLK